MLKQVLLIDDSDPDLIYGRVVLQRAGIAAEVIPVGSGPEALDYLRSPAGRDVELIVLDINMPEMDGFEFLAAYEGLPESQRRAAVAMLTSSPDPVDRERALSHRCVKRYSTKPIDRAAASGLAALRPDPSGSAPS